jgi:hypothetical protein
VRKLVRYIVQKASYPLHKQAKPFHTTHNSHSIIGKVLEDNSIHGEAKSCLTQLMNKQLQH